MGAVCISLSNFNAVESFKEVIGEILKCINERITSQSLWYTFVGDAIYILFLLFLQNLNRSVMVFMLSVAREYYSIQTPLICKSPVDDLDDYHLAN